METINRSFPSLERILTNLSFKIHRNDINKEIHNNVEAVYYRLLAAGSNAVRLPRSMTLKDKMRDRFYNWIRKYIPEKYMDKARHGFEY